MNFESIALSIQEKKLKANFQDGCHAHNLGFPTATIWAIFYLQVDASYQVLSQLAIQFRRRRKN